MIDVSQIKNVKELQEIKDALNFFINKKIVASLYEEDGKTKEDLAEDRRLAREVFEKVIARLAQLDVSQSAKKKGSRFPPKVTKETPLAKQSSEERGCDPCKE